MSNSALVDYVDLSPHYYSRDGAKITTITVHHMAGKLTIEECGRLFHSRKASSNYGIDSKGRVAMYVPEKYGAWTNGNAYSNKKSVTIEVANDQIGGNWHVSDKALAKCIELCADICKRNGIVKLNFTGNRNGNLDMHRYWMATGCPGDYLASKFPYIQNEVNKILGQGDGKLVVDGLFGEQSTMRLQKMLAIVQDGWVGGQTNTVKPYIPNWTTAKYNDGYTGSTTIDRMQRWLKSKGYSVGTIDGLCGKKTVTALQKFLNAGKFEVGAEDGIFGAKTAKAFQRYLNTLS